MDRKLASRGLLLLACPLALSATAAVGWTLSTEKSATLENAKYLLARGDAAAAEPLIRARDDAESRFLLGKLLSEQGRWTEARSPLLDSLCCEERRPQALRYLAKGALQTQDWDSASRHLAELERTHPNEVGLPKALAISYLKSGDALAAMGAAQRALSLSPDDREIISLLSEASDVSPAEIPA
jgi:Flp pilus assembly protein TadD